MTKRQIKKDISSFAGFTLVELIVVMSILVVLGSIAFISVSGYISNSRDSKRISNTETIAKGFDIAIAQGTIINTSKTATGYNIAIAGSGLTMTGYYGIINDTLLASIRVAGKDIAVYDGFQEYRYGYYPNEKKYQIFATLENPENARSAFVVPSIVDQVFAATGSVGYVFIKGNFTATGGITTLVVDGSAWNGKTPVDGIESFSGSETVVAGSAAVIVPATSVPADGQCGGSSGGSFTAIPTINLCAVGTSTGMTDTGIGSNFIWGCTGVNGGNTTASNACSATHSLANCIFDGTGSNFDQCTFQ